MSRKTTNKEIRANTRDWAKKLIAKYSRKTVSAAPILYTDDGMDRLIEDIKNTYETNNTPTPVHERVYLRGFELGAL